jgi:hypothetical protein
MGFERTQHRRPAGGRRQRLTQSSRLQPWLQFWLQLAAFATVRRQSPLCKAARQPAYGTAVNRAERDHDGLAVWEAGVRVPSAPPI